MEVSTNGNQFLDRSQPVLNSRHCHYGMLIMTTLHHSLIMPNTHSVDGQLQT